MGSTGQGRLIIISGPSGAGKSTVVRHLLQECDLPLTLEYLGYHPPTPSG